MSQAVNTVWINRIQATMEAGSIAQGKVRVRRAIDGLIMMVILAASCICVSLYYRTSTEMAAAKIKYQEAAARVEQLMVETQILEREAKQMRTDARRIEAIARRELGLVREGDVVIKIKQELRASSASAASMESNLTQQ